MEATKIKLNQVLCGKSEEKLKDFPDNSFSGIITDPPYELNFMGKSWDASGIAYNVELWKEVLRTAKPGAFLLCFGGTRTYHRVVCAIEDSGWIIKDQMQWIYGEGFPKSTNIGKQLDKEAGAEREVVGEANSGLHRGSGNTVSYGVGNDRDSIVPITSPATNDAKRWDGYGTGLKPGWEPIIVAMKPLEQGLTYAQNAKKWGVAGLNINGGRIGTKEQLQGGSRQIGDGNIYGTIKETDDGYKQNSQGRWPSNVILSHSPDCVCVGTKIINEGAEGQSYNFDKSNNENNSHIITNIKSGQHHGQETVEVYACVPDCPIRIMDGQSGILRTHAGIYRNKGKCNWTNEKPIGYTTSTGNSGGASRFFYCAKAKRSEKEAGLIGFNECVKCEKFNSKEHIIIVDGEKRKEKCTRNNHPTVKPLDLMKYLINLIKMPSADENNQVILDPFCGSGTTLVAAEQLRINYIGIDMDSDSCLTSIGRIG